MIIAYSVFADGLSQTPVFASPLDRGRFMPHSQREFIMNNPEHHVK
jgi:hypothetical protein